MYADPDAPGLTDVRQFVEESSLNVEVGAEMEPVADTFRGVENLNGFFNWEGPDGSPSKKQPQNESRFVEVFFTSPSFATKFQSKKAHLLS